MCAGPCSSGEAGDATICQTQGSFRFVPLFLVFLLFYACAATAIGSKSFDCTLVSMLETYDDQENGYFLD